MNNCESYWYSPPNRRPGPGRDPQGDPPHFEDPGRNAYGNFYRRLRRGDFEKVFPCRRNVPVGPVLRGGPGQPDRPGRRRLRHGAGYRRGGAGEAGLAPQAHLPADGRTGPGPEKLCHQLGEYGPCGPERPRGGGGGVPGGLLGGLHGRGDAYQRGEDLAPGQRRGGGERQSGGHVPLPAVGGVKSLGKLRKTLDFPENRCYNYEQ